MPMENELERRGRSILDRLEAAGYEAFFVGGYVRDKCWGRPVKDIDIATSALPAEVLRLFERTVPTGLKHGTVTVLIEGTPFEVTTYRKESDYADYRRPAEVEFIPDLEEDLKRRDFTINAMAMDRSGTVRDPFGGRADMERKLLRCVGDPQERFREDALRMLRCIRFASTYGLDVEAGTWEALSLRKDLLRHVAMERVRMELERMVAGPSPLRGWNMLLDSGLLACLKEPLSWRYTAMMSNGLPVYMKALEHLASPTHRWCLIMRESGLDPEGIRELLRKLTFSSKDTERIARTADVGQWLAEAAHRIRTGEPEEGIPFCSLADRWKLVSLRLGTEAMTDWLEVQEQAAHAGLELAPEAEDLLRSGRSWLVERPVTELKELAVTGKEIMAASGRPAGPWLGQAMQRLLKLAALGRLPNRKEALLHEALQDGEQGGTA